MAATMSGRQLRDSLHVCAQILTGDVRDAIYRGYTGDNVRTGGLARSFRPYSEIRDGRGRIASESDLIYARVQDQGGIVRPRVMKHLAIPLIRLPVGKWPRHFPRDGRGRLFMLRKKGGEPRWILARKKGKRGVEAVFLLRKWVRIPAKHYLETASRTAIPKILRYLARRIDEGGA